MTTNAKQADFRRDPVIDELRKTYKPTPVRQHHLPKWFKTKLANWLKAEGYRPGREPLYVFSYVTEWSLDHWGSSENGQVFVSEPYRSPTTEGAAAMLAKNKHIAEILDCDFSELANSYWFPGRTTRYEFRNRS